MSVAIRHALIMAAGRGNRMRPLTDALPKAMMAIGESTLVGSSIERLRKVVSHIHVTVGYKAAMLADYLMSAGVDTVLYTEGHSASWWIHNTLMSRVDEPVLVLTCDNITQIDTRFLSAEYERMGRPACMLVPVQPIRGVEGDYLRLDGDAVLDVRRDQPSDRYCSGIQVLNPAIVASLTENSGDFYSVWTRLIALKQLGAARIYPYPWFTVDTLEQLARARSDQA